MQVQVAGKPHAPEFVPEVGVGGLQVGGDAQVVLEEGAGARVQHHLYGGGQGGQGWGGAHHHRQHSLGKVSL